ncbi:MAG: carboxypeptidase regulatory-like domain-containing protein [Bryobacteraceae bacterium]
MSRRLMLVVALITVLIALSVPAPAQSLITGGLAGTITDSSGAVVPDAAVMLKNLDTGAVQNGATNQSGAYRFTLLKPGKYMVSVALAGFQKAERSVQVAVGGIVTADLVLEVGPSTQTVEVAAVAPLINPEASMNTPYSPTEVQALPSAGGDLTNIAFTAPGVVVNNTGGYGNFTINGLPATSNLFTVNGENNMDPYFNTNNSGATNLTLGQNEVSEVTVVANPYGGQFGQLAGAQVTYVTKSGSNQFHGNALYGWNGRAMNANDWFNNMYDTPRPFANANQWAASVGGPIRKDKTFFFVNTEGLRFVLPNVISMTIPTTDFANAVLANVTAKQPNEAGTYDKMLKLWLNAPGAASAQPIANTSACNNLVLAGFDPATQNCAAKYQATPTALASEWILSGRVDQKLGNNDNAFFRYKLDRGTQPTTLDPVSSNFNAISHQPSWDTQLNETHIFGPRSSNNFMATLSYYFALFQQNHDLAYQTFPYQVITSGTVPFTGFNPMVNFPQGRNITQYQFIDDYTLIRGNHNLKFGANFRRYDVSDHNFYFNYPGVYFGYVSSGLQKFVDGRGYQYRQTLNQADNVPVAMWGMGLYAHDEWKIAPRLSLTLALRVERNSNPVCQTNCFANFKLPWSTLASVTSPDPGSVPYSADIASGLHQAYPGVDGLLWSPRVGFSWSPGKDSKTVISGGFGIFYDNPAAGMVDNLLANPPVSVSIRVRPSTGVLPFDPAGGAATWAASAKAFSLDKTYSQIASELQALGSVFAAPAVTSIAGTIHAPQWYEWNFQVQREITHSTSLTMNYVGNRGSRIPYSNAWMNTFDLYGIFTALPVIPAEAPVANYGTVTQLQSGAISNYQGLTTSFRKQFSRWFSAHLNYTWSHNLDEASNGGLFTYGESLLGFINPTSLRANNYGNSDYDVRHSLNADYVVTPKFDFNSPVLKHLLNGWEWSGKIFWRTGLPFSVIDGNWNGALGNGGGTILATPTASYGSAQTSCGAGAAVTPCLNASAFLDSASADFMGYSAWSGQTRNQFRGPHYFNADMSLHRTFKFGENRTFGIGVNAFNVFNHPNFGFPDYNLGDPDFGKVTATVSTPTSPYGNFLGFDSSVRVVQLSAKIVF